jgi:aminopeptidase N
VHRDTVAVEVEGPVTELAALGEPASLLLLNDGDLTFATVRPDDASLAELVNGAGGLPSAVARAVALSTVWDLLITGALPAAGFVRCATGVLATEDADTLLEPFLRRAVEAAEMWAPDARRDSLLDSIAQTCLVVADKGGAKRIAALRALARAAVTDDQLAALRSAASDDVDLQWRLLTRLAALGRHQAAEAEELRHRDPDPDAWVRALTVEAARSDEAAKTAAWQAVVDERKVPIGSLFELSTAFWQPSQADVLAGFAERYLDVLPALGRSAMIPAMTTSGAMFPMVGVDDAYIDRVVAVANGPDVSPVVATRVLERADRLHWMLVARRNDG